MKIKVCGNKNSEGLSAMDALGVDMVGLIFHSSSPRNFIDPKSIATRAKKIGVFVNESQAFIEQKIKEHALDGIQLHGDESPTFCESFQSKNLLILKAFRIDESFNFEDLLDYRDPVDYFLFDTKGKVYGGTGTKFDWDLLSKYQLDVPFLLSGGIAPTDAENLRNLKHPQMAGIDINSKFEIEPGIKNVALIQTFLNELHAIQSHQ